MIRTGLFLAPLFLAGACVSEGHQHHNNDVRPPPGSNQMLRAPITISEDLEVIVSDVVIPADATVPRHFHPGEEFIYVIEGSAIHVEDGKPDQVLGAGDAYVIPPEAEHAPRGGPDGARAIVFRVHKDGLPERINMGDNGPLPDSKDLGLRSSESDLADLREKIEGRADAHCHAMASPAVMCHVANGREVYTFTEAGTGAHPSALFRGFVVGDDGRSKLQERGWSAAEDGAAQAFFASVRMWPDTGLEP